MICRAGLSIRSRQPIRIGSCNALPLLFELMNHLRGQFTGRRMPRQLISCGEEESFKRLRLGREIANERGIPGRVDELSRVHQFCCFEFVSDIKESLAFPNREGLLIDLPVGEFPENVVPRYGMIEIVFARFEGAFGMPPRVNLEAQAAANHAVLLE